MVSILLFSIKFRLSNYPYLFKNLDQKQNYGNSIFQIFAILLSCSIFSDQLGVTKMYINVTGDGLNITDTYSYISGSYFICKKHIMIEFPLNEILLHCQGEDVEWSLRVRRKAKLIKRFDLVFKYLKFKDDDPSMDKNWNENLNILLKKNK